jgi:hypothetical protein
MRSGRSRDRGAGAVAARGSARTLALVSVALVIA